MIDWRDMATIWLIMAAGLMLGLAIAADEREADHTRDVLAECLDLADELAATASESQAVAWACLAGPSECLCMPEQSIEVSR